jgi:hypothetical protein
MIVLVFRALKKGPKGPCDQRIALFADGLPAPGDAPPKYDNKISHGGLTRLLCFAGNLTSRRVDVKHFPAADKVLSFLRSWIVVPHQALPR